MPVRLQLAKFVHELVHVHQDLDVRIIDNRFLDNGRTQQVVYFLRHYTGNTVKFLTVLIIYRMKSAIAPLVIGFHASSIPSTFNTDGTLRIFETNSSMITSVTTGNKIG